MVPQFSKPDRSTQRQAFFSTQARVISLVVVLIMVLGLDRCYGLILCFLVIETELSPLAVLLVFVVNTVQLQLGGLSQ